MKTYKLMVVAVLLVIAALFVYATADSAPPIPAQPEMQGGMYVSPVHADSTQ